MTDADPPPGLRLHPRTMQVQRAGGDLGRILVDWADRHELTDIEACVEITAQLQSFLKYPLRAERHPEDPERKADEE